MTAARILDAAERLGAMLNQTQDVLGLSRACASEDAKSRFNALGYGNWKLYDWLRRKGVSEVALAEPELPHVGRVLFHVDQPFFDFADDVGENGIDALIFIARDALGDPCDLVAWTLNHRKLAPWYGAAALLGAEDILATRLTPEGALPVHRTPLGWLRAGREGVVLIEERRAALEIRDFGPLAAEDEVHAKELQQLFRRREPQIYVPKKRKAA